MATQSKVELVLRKSFEKVRIVFSIGSEVMVEMSESSLNKSGFVVLPPSTFGPDSSKSQKSTKNVNTNLTIEKGRFCCTLSVEHC